jgi:hypothetical protein
MAEKHKHKDCAHARRMSISDGRYYCVKGGSCWIQPEEEACESFQSDPWEGTCARCVHFTYHFGQHCGRCDARGCAHRAP